MEDNFTGKRPRALQQDLDNVYQWAANNNTSFNNLKCEDLRFGAESMLNATTNHASPGGTIIDTKDHSSGAARNRVYF